ncbi:MAG TPA: hypothetical protein VIG06_04520 [Kofleriaceae bacterium]|jgi:hypothetical protein
MLRRFLVAVPLLLAEPPRADACSEEAPEPFTIDADSTDVNAPARPILLDAWIERSDPPPGTDPDEECSGALARLFVELSVGDDQTSADELGFTTRVVVGGVPFEPDLESLEVRRGLSVAAATVDVVYRWGRSAWDDPVEAMIELTPIDRAGNRGPSVLVELSDPGTEDGGCSAAGGGAVAPGLLVLLFFLLVRIGRKIQPCAPRSSRSSSP